MTSLLDEGDSDSMDSFFEDSFDYDNAIEYDFSSDSVEDSISSGSDTDLNEDSKENWNFILVCLKKNKDAKKIIKKLNSNLEIKNANLIAQNWRHAAGSTAIYLYWTRIIFNIGIIIILTAGFIIINNTLVITVMERTREIATLRAIGANRFFISTECALETFFISLVSGIIGFFVAVLICSIINLSSIELKNDFLVQLFGSQVLKTKITFFNAGRSFFITLLLGLLGWIIPIKIALRVKPASAMLGGK